MGDNENNLRRAVSACNGGSVVEVNNLNFYFENYDNLYTKINSYVEIYAEVFTKLKFNE